MTGSANRGNLDLLACQQLCDTEPDCIAIEVNGCLAGGASCGGACYTYTGDADGTITNRNCNISGDQKAYKKVTGADHWPR